MNDHEGKLVNPGLGNLIASQPYSTNQAPAAPSLEQLEKDAARYRWLRAEHESAGRTFHVRLPNNEIPEFLDHAIDAAMLTSSPDKT